MFQKIAKHRANDVHRPPLHRLAQGAGTLAQTSTKRGLHRLERPCCCWHNRKDLHKELAQSHTLAQGLAQRLAPGACTFAQAAVTWGGDGETLKMS